MKLYPLVSLFLGLFLVNGAFAAKKKDIFGSKLKSDILADRGYSKRKLGSLFLSRKQCKELALENLKDARKSIKSFAMGDKIRWIDIEGEFTARQSEDYGHYAKMGLSDDHEYEVEKLKTQYAIHADARCARYARVTKRDKTSYRNKICRRVHIQFDDLQYKTFFCVGDKKAYVDHFDLTKALR